MATSRPPPNAVPWMATITGFLLSSIFRRNGSRPAPRNLPEVILPNSLMSAPAMKVRPPPTRNGFDVGVLRDLVERLGNALGDAGAERVDGRIIDGDHGDVVLFCELDEICHREIPWFVNLEFRDRP